MPGSLRVGEGQDVGPVRPGRPADEFLATIDYVVAPVLHGRGANGGEV